MKKKKFVTTALRLTLVTCILLFVSYCGISQDEGAIMTREAELAGRSGINLEIDTIKTALNTAPDDHERAVKCEKIAELQSAKGNTAAVLEYSRQSVKYQPNLFMARYLLGKAYMDLGRHGDAEVEFRKSIDIKNDFAPSHFELGNALYKKYDYTGAIREYLTAVRINPDHFQALNNVATVYVEIRKFAEAEKVLKIAVQLRPDFAVGYKNLGVLYETRMNNRAMALDCYGKYLKARPDSPDREMVKSWIRLLEGRS